MKTIKKIISEVALWLIIGLQFILPFLFIKSKSEKKEIIIKPRIKITKKHFKKH